MPGPNQIFRKEENPQLIQNETNQQNVGEFLQWRNGNKKG